MSAENVELVRQLYEWFAARENAKPFEVYDPDIEWDVSRQFATGPVPGFGVGFDQVYRGHEGVRSFWRQWLEAWESIEFRLDDLIDAGDEVVALLWQVNRGRASGVEVLVGEWAQVWTVRDRKVVRMRAFRDRADALRAAGLG
jgi:ketosteroid isomerase-like protein